MKGEFPTREDITTKVNRPFPINRDETWICIGVGKRGAILQQGDDPTVWRWLGQVIKFSPQDEYIAPETFEMLLRKGGAAGAKWKAS